MKYLLSLVGSSLGGFLCVGCPAALPSFCLCRRGAAIVNPSDYLSNVLYHAVR